MLSIARNLSAALIAAMVLSFATGVAQANRTILRVGGDSGVTASSRLVLNGVELRASTRIECNVTLLRTISRLIPKVIGTLIGRITGIQIEFPGCSIGEGVPGFRRVNVLQERGVIAPNRVVGNVTFFDLSRAPGTLWKLIYDGFQGTLPEINGINFHIAGVQFELEAAVNCLYRGEAFGLIAIARRRITGATAVLARTRLARDSGSIFCPVPETTFSGSFAVSPPIEIVLL